MSTSEKGDIIVLETSLWVSIKPKKGLLNQLSAAGFSCSRYDLGLACTCRDYWLGRATSITVCLMW